MQVEGLSRSHAADAGRAYPLLLQLFISLFPISLSLALATWPGYPAAYYLPSLALAALAAVAARRASTRSSKPLGTPDA